MNGPALEAEAQSLWDELAPLLSELDRRRRETLDVGVQLRRHPQLVVAGALALAGTFAVWLWRRRPTIIVVRCPLLGR